MFKLQFKTDNAAFRDEYRGREIARILTVLAESVWDEMLGEGGRTEGPIMDRNGNKVGEWSLAPDGD